MQRRALLCLIAASTALVASALALLLYLSYDAQALSNDTWKHYVSGGLYITDSPCLDAADTSVIFSSPATGCGDIYGTDIRTGRTARMTFGSSCDLSPQFLPGRKSILFIREKSPYSHLWILDPGAHEHRQLTNGRVQDEVLDIAADGKQILIYRAYTQYSGATYVLHIDTDALHKLPYFPARFSNRGASVIGNKSSELNVSEQSVVSGVTQDLFRGWLADVDDQAGVVVSYGSSGGNPDVQLQAYRRGTRDVLDIGRGHSPTLFANGKVLYFSGYEHKAWVWEPKSNTSRAIDSPNGYKYRPRRSPSGTVASLFIKYPDPSTIVSNRELHIFMFDSTTEKFTELPVAPAIK